MKRILWALLLVLTANVAEAQRYIVYSMKGKVEEVKASKTRNLNLRDAVSPSTVLNVPVDGCVILFDETNARQYTLKTPGRATVADMIGDKKNSVSKLTGDYLSFVREQIAKGGQVLVLNCSDPATVTRNLQVSTSYARNSKGGNDLIVCGTAESFLDEYHALADKVLNEYHEFTADVLKRYVDYRNKVIGEFANKVGDSRSWREVGRLEVYEPEEEPKEEEEDKIVPFRIEPHESHALTPDFEIKDRKLNVTIAKIPLPKPLPTPQAIALAGRIEELPDDSRQYHKFTFYGTEMKVRWSEDCRFQLEKINERSLSKAIKDLTDSKYNNLLYDCIELRNSYNLSDWAYYQLLEQLSGSLLGKGTNEARLLMAMLYSQSGYMMRLARTADKVLMLISTQFNLHKYGYLNIDGHHFYLLDDEFNGVTLCDAKFPKEQEMSLIMKESPKFAEAMTETRTIASPFSSKSWLKASVSVNRNLIDFYNTYPTSYFNNDFMTRWAMYANKEMQPEVREQLYPQLEPWVRGKSQREGAENILNWIQTAMDYGYDSQIWGYDRAFFAEETLFYPSCDCEDRSILFTRLIRDLLGLKCILVYYPGHLASGVHFTEDVKGDYIEVDGDKYVICDPTIIGIGAPVGQTMSSMDNSTANVIVLD